MSKRRYGDSALYFRVKVSLDRIYSIYLDILYYSYIVVSNVVCY